LSNASRSGCRGGNPTHQSPERGDPGPAEQNEFAAGVCPRDAHPPRRQLATRGQELAARFIRAPHHCLLPTRATAAAGGSARPVQARVYRIHIARRRAARRASASPRSQGCRWWRRTSRFRG
jgi:hypothetical protein